MEREGVVKTVDFLYAEALKSISKCFVSSNDVRGIIDHGQWTYSMCKVGSMNGDGSMVTLLCW